MNDGSEMTLARRGDEHSLRIDGDVLMTSRSHGSEEKLAERGCAGLDTLPRARVLVGGLGMGFTARAALAALRPDAVVDVVELVGAVVRWNRELIGHLADAPLLDPRVRVIEGDVAEVIGTARERYDAILLDVDNGPEAFTSGGMSTFTRARGCGARERLCGRTASSPSGRCSSRAPSRRASARPTSRRASSACAPMAIRTACTRSGWDGALTPERLTRQADALAVQWAFPCRRNRTTQVSQISRPDAAASSIVR